jgi:hypothetical protein
VASERRASLELEQKPRFKEAFYEIRFVILSLFGTSTRAQSNLSKLV